MFVTVSVVFMFCYVVTNLLLTAASGDRRQGFVVCLPARHPASGRWGIARRSCMWLALNRVASVGRWPRSSSDRWQRRLS